MELKEKERREALRKTGGAEGRETKAQEVQSVIKGKRESCRQREGIARSGNGVSVR